MLKQPGATAETVSAAYALGYEVVAAIAEEYAEEIQAAQLSTKMAPELINNLKSEIQMAALEKLATKVHQTYRTVDLLAILKIAVPSDAKPTHIHNGDQNTTIILQNLPTHLLQQLSPAIEFNDKNQAISIGESPLSTITKDRLNDILQKSSVARTNNLDAEMDL